MGGAEGSRTHGSGVKGRAPSERSTAAAIAEAGVDGAVHKKEIREIAGGVA
jgi:hypothetical protein